MDAVEEADGEGGAAFPGVAAEPGHHVLEPVGPGVFGQADDLAVDHQGGAREGAHQLDHRPQARRHVVTVPREEPHLVTRAVGLEPGAVQLLLHRRRAAVPREGVRHGVARRRQHGLYEAPHLQPDLRQSVGTLGQRHRRDHRQVPGQHRCPPDQRQRHPRRLGHGVGHQPGQRPLAQLAQQQPPEEGLLILGGSRHQGAEPAGAHGLGSGAGGDSQLVQGPVEAADGERRGGGRWDLESAHGGPTDPDPALPDHARERGDHHLDLVGVQPPDQVGQRGHLGRPAGRRGDGSGRGDDFAQQHRLILATPVWVRARVAVPPGVGRVDRWVMGETLGHIKKVLGNVTEDREVEAEGRSEEATGDKPDHETMEKVEDEVQEARGEKHQGPSHG